jgi:ureidoglycolate hydrolase
MRADIINHQEKSKDQDMDNQLLEVVGMQCEGFKPLIFCNSWRVAALRYMDSLYPPAIDRFERHLETDEVFLLLDGQAILLIVKDENQLPEPVWMEPQKIYNVRQNCWHGIIMSRDANILLVENGDTGESNSEFFSLNSRQKTCILETARSMPAWAEI